MTALFRSVLTFMPIRTSRFYLILFANSFMIAFYVEILESFRFYLEASSID